MKKFLLAGVGATALLVVSSPVDAADPPAAPEYYPGPTFFLTSEATFLRFRQVDGVRESGGAFPTDNASFDYEAGVRVTGGVQFGDGSGLRARYWNHSDDTADAAGGPLSVDAEVLDIEYFKEVQAGPSTLIEFSGGLRYLDFFYNRGANDQYSINDAFGVVAGVQTTHALGFANLIVRGRTAAVFGDGQFESSNPIDMVRTQHEVGIGLERSFMLGNHLATIGAGYEWQLWTDAIGSNDDDDDPVDVSFDGFYLSANVAFGEDAGEPELLPPDLASATFFLTSEATFLRFRQADGVRDANNAFPGSNASFDHEAGVRVTGGVQFGDDAGLRARYWNHSDDTVSASGTVMNVDAEVLDIEYFKEVQVGSSTLVEFSGGLRYLDFFYNRGADDQYSINDAFGVVAGVAATQKFSFVDLTLRARSATVFGDGQFESSNPIDMVRTQHEVGIGLERSFMLGDHLATIGAGYEWQLWSNAIGSNDDDDDPVNVSFDGFFLSATLEFGGARP